MQRLGSPIAGLAVCTLGWSELATGWIGRQRTTNCSIDKRIAKRDNLWTVEEETTIQELGDKLDVLTQGGYVGGPVLAAFNTIDDLAVITSKWYVLS